MNDEIGDLLFHLTEEEQSDWGWFNVGGMHGQSWLDDRERFIVRMKEKYSHLPPKELPILESNIGKDGDVVHVLAGGVKGFAWYKIKRI